LITHIKDLKLRVKEALTDTPKTRDNDYYLVSIIWYYQIKKEERVDKTAVSFLKELSQSAYASPESIRRLRQLLQAEHPHLRGENYKKRKINLEQEVRNEIKNV